MLPWSRLTKQINSSHLINSGPTYLHCSQHLFTRNSLIFWRNTLRRTPRTRRIWNFLWGGMSKDHLNHRTQLSPPPPLITKYQATNKKFQIDSFPSRTWILGQIIGSPSMVTNARRVDFVLELNGKLIHKAKGWNWNFWWNWRFYALVRVTIDN